MDKKEEQKKPLQDVTDELANEASEEDGSAASEEAKQRRAQAEREVAEKR